MSHAHMSSNLCVLCSCLSLLSFKSQILSMQLPSVLWCCWLGDRKGIRPVKNRVVGCWCGCLSGARQCHCHLLSLASAKSRLVLTFWYWLTRVVPEKRAFKRVCVCSLNTIQERNLYCMALLWSSHRRNIRIHGTNVLQFGVLLVELRAKLRDAIADLKRIEVGSTFGWKTGCKECSVEEWSPKENETVCIMCMWLLMLLMQILRKSRYDSISPSVAPLLMFELFVIKRLEQAKASAMSLFW